MAPNRRCGFAAVLAVAVSAGTIDSSSGSARVTPMPRRNVRRGNAILVINIEAPSICCDNVRLSGFDPLLKRRAVDDAENERREPVVLRGAVADDLPHFRHV